MGHITGRVAVVTGASSGIGRAVALALAGAGARVVLVARRSTLLATLAEEVAALGAEAVTVTADVREEGDVVALFEHVDRQFGGVDILVNAAGVADHTPTDELSLATWNNMLSSNLTSAMLCSREAFRRMKGRGRGRIINIGSASAYRPRADNAAYAVTKFGLLGLTHSLAIDGRPFGISASIMHPGSTRSGLAGDMAAAEVAMMEAEDVARVVLLHADLPDDVNLFESLTIPVGMEFLGRG